MLSSAVFIYCFFSSRISIWFFLCEFYIFVKLFILLMYHLPDCIELPLCFLTAHWFSFKSLFWIICQVNCRSASLWDWLLLDLNSLVSYLLDFFKWLLKWSLALLSLYRKYQSPSELKYQSLLIAFGRKRHGFHNPCRDSDALQTFYDYTCPPVSEYNCEYNCPLWIQLSM